ncbi:MAG: hypothetical protein H7831_03080 [Magnetococcus sp. WYHC-3]
MYIAPTTILRNALNTSEKAAVQGFYEDIKRDSISSMYSAPFLKATKENPDARMGRLLYTVIPQKMLDSVKLLESDEDSSAFLKIQQDVYWGIKFFDSLGLRFEIGFMPELRAAIIDRLSKQIETADKFCNVNREVTWAMDTLTVIGETLSKTEKDTFLKQLSQRFIKDREEKNLVFNDFKLTTKWHLDAMEAVIDSYRAADAQTRSIPVNNTPGPVIH